MASTPFAGPLDLADRWRDLTEAEERRACVLLDDASQMIRDQYSDIDQRVINGELSPTTLTRIVCGMVQRAMIGGTGELAGVTAQTDVVGPFQRQQTYSNPLGNLYLSADDLRSLEAPAFAAKRAFVIDLDPSPGRSVGQPRWSW